MRIIFIDPVCPKPYDPQVLATEPLGGTEGTVIRVAEGLANRPGVEFVRIAQHNREDPFQGFAYYGPFRETGHTSPTHVIVLRAPLALYQARKQFPNAKLYLWCHDMFSPQGWDKGFQALVDTQAVPIVVSEWHKSNMYEIMKAINFGGYIPCRKIYNPIADNLEPDETPVDNNKLVFFSSPHKGLEHTLKIFERFRDFDELRDMKLYVANPGYYASTDTSYYRNVIQLGELSHGDVINHVRSSLAAFHLNSVFPETMGLVHAEANAVGIPFLSSRLGATPEVADHPSELIDVKDPKAVIDRIISWKTRGRPKVLGNSRFRLKNVIREWISLLSL